MDIETYKKIRQEATDLMDKIYTIIGKNDMSDAAKLLGMLVNGTFVLEENDDIALMDLVIFEKYKRTDKLIDKFYDSDIKLNDLEEDILEGMIDCHSSLFQIVTVDKKKHELSLVDLLDKDKTIYTLIDINLSLSDIIDIVTYLRLIPIEDVYMTSGVSFPFLPTEKNKLLKEISFNKMKKGAKLSSLELFIMMYCKHKIYGIKSDAKNIW